MTKEITIQKELSAYEVSANKLVIKTETDRNDAVSLLSNVNKVLDKATEEKEKVTAPLNEALKAERARWKPIETACSTAIATIKAKMVTFQMALEASRRVKEAKIEAKVESGVLTPQTASRKLEALATIRRTVTTDAGAISWRTVKRVDIFDTSALPARYMIPNETMIRKDALAGIEIPGVRITEDKVPANFR